MFLNSVKCEEAKKACFKLLAKNPEGDIRKLVTALQSIEAYPDKEIAKVKPVVLCEAGGKCNFRGRIRSRKRRTRNRRRKGTS